MDRHSTGSGAGDAAKTQTIVQGPRWTARGGMQAATNDFRRYEDMAHGAGRHDRDTHAGSWKNPTLVALHGSVSCSKSDAKVHRIDTHAAMGPKPLNPWRPNGLCDSAAPHLGQPQVLCSRGSGKVDP